MSLQKKKTAASAAASVGQTVPKDSRDVAWELTHPDHRRDKKRMQYLTVLTSTGGISDVILPHAILRSVTEKLPQPSRRQCPVYCQKTGSASDW